MHDSNQQHCRYQVNHEVRSVLVRHAVNLALLEYSFTGQTLYLYGSLKRDPSGEFISRDVQGLLKEISRIPRIKGVQVEVDNWTIYASDGSWSACRKRAPAAGREDTTVHIREQEFIREVLQDLEAGKDG